MDSTAISGLVRSTDAAYNQASVRKYRMTANKLRVLLVEASSADAQHTLNKLTQAGYLLEHRRVESARGMKSALTSM